MRIDVFRKVVVNDGNAVSLFESEFETMVAILKSIYY